MPLCVAAVVNRRASASADDFSHKVTVLSFLAMVSVVYIHHNAIDTTEPAYWNVVVQTFLTRALTDWAVPFFFIMSGFWVARSRYVSSEGATPFLMKKVRTLLVPYVLWAVLGAVISMPVIVFNNYVNHMPLLSRTCLGQEGVWENLDFLLGLTRNGPGGNLALWYVRTLLVFFLAVPVWRFLFRWSRMLPLLIGLPLVLVAPAAWIPGTGLKVGSFGWLLCGMGMSTWLFENRRLPFWGAVLCGLAWISLSLAKAFGIEAWPQLIPVAAIACLWSISDWTRFYRGWMKPTFWVYCLHGALAAYTLAGPLFLFGKSGVSLLLIMLTMPWVNIGTCLLLAELVRRQMPKLYVALTGGRA